MKSTTFPQANKPVWLWIIGVTHPPVAVEARSPFDEGPSPEEVDATLKGMLG
jgi:hypothetical protein